MAVNSFSERKKDIQALFEKLTSPLTMSMFLKREDLEAELYKQRQEAAAMLKRILEES